jgi:hypothetical protein
MEVVRKCLVFIANENTGIEVRHLYFTFLETAVHMRILTVLLRQDKWCVNVVRKSTSFFYDFESPRYIFLLPYGQGYFFIPL